MVIFTLSIAIVCLLTILIVVLFSYKSLKSDNNMITKHYENAIREIEELNNMNAEYGLKVHNLEESIEDTLKALNLGDLSEIQKALNNIHKNYVISNANRLVLIKMFVAFLISNQSRLTIDDMKVNKETLSANAKYLKRFYVDRETVSEKDLDNIGSAILTLIMYKPRISTY